MRSFVSFITVCALAFSAVADDHLVPVRSISVRGEAEIKVAPDQANIDVTVYTEHKDLVTVKDENNKKLKTLLGLAEKAGIKKDDIRTQYSRIEPQYTYPDNRKPVFNHYVASNQVELTIKDITKLGEFTDNLVKAGFDRIGNINFDLQDRKKNENELLSKALLNAKSRADGMAQTLGQKVGKPLTVSDTGSSYQPPVPVYREAMMMKAASAPMANQAMDTAVPAGQITMNQQVSVTFELQ